MSLSPAIMRVRCCKCRKVIERGEMMLGRGNAARHPDCAPRAGAKESLAASRALHPLDPSLAFHAEDGRGLYPFQVAGIEYMLARTGVINADEMGLGKTVQAIGVLNFDLSIHSALIVCPASLKLNWRAELRAWLHRDLTVALWPNPANIQIVNYDLLDRVAGEWDAVVFDEAHYLKNAKAKRSTNAKRIAKRAKRRVLLTGTPIDARPLELWHLLQIADPDEWDPSGVKRVRLPGRTLPSDIDVEAGEGAGFWRFAGRYCGPVKRWVGKRQVTELTGASNLDELSTRLRSTCMVRRKKLDVLTDLPPKRRQLVVLGQEVTPLDPNLRLEKLTVDNYDAVLAALQGVVGSFIELADLRHRNAVAKVPLAIEHLRNLLEVEEVPKVVVFAHHKDVVDALVSGLLDFGVAVVTGDRSVEDRHAAVTSFQSASGPRVFVGSLFAAGVGLTLTAASLVVFVELDWSPAVMNQAEDRVHRISQRDSVLVQHLLVENTLDATIARVLVRKQRIIEEAIA